MQEYGMPAGSGEHIKRLDEGEPTLGKDDQTMYRRGVGLLLYLIKIGRASCRERVC